MDDSEAKGGSLTPIPIEVPEYPERILLDLRTDCNLKCPMCLLHGSDDEEKKESAIGIMSVEQAKIILDEVMQAKPLIQPSMWGEPLLAKNLREHLKSMKDQGVSVCMNTNGLTLREDLARYFVEIKLDSIFFSIDATTPETLKKVRGIDRLERIKQNLEMMLRVRTDMAALLPRIGATMTVQEENQHEVAEFIKYWINHADVVRLGSVFEDGRLTGITLPAQRVPCRSLYQTMPIHFNGNVSICCWDSFGTEIMGNVFADGGVKAVWHGEKFTELRRLHETNQYDKVPFCQNCNAWAGYLYEETVDQINDTHVLVRRSPQFIYYNRIDQLDSWHSCIRGHALPQRNEQGQLKL